MQAEKFLQQRLLDSTDTHSANQSTRIIATSAIQSPGTRLARWGLLSVVDQCLFSGTNFVSAVLVGRFAGAEELGVYALCFSLVMLAIGVQRALLVSPFVVVSSKLDGKQLPAMRGSMLAATLLLCLALCMLAASAFPFLSVTMTATLFVALPAGLLRDFQRRLAVAEMRFGIAVWLDLLIALAQLSVLAWLAMQARLSAPTALLASSAVWMVISVGGVIFARRLFFFSRKTFVLDIARLWPIGRWIAMSQLLSTMQSFILPWVMACAHSTALAGVYAACWSIVQVMSPVIEGLGNMLGPIMARSIGAPTLNTLRQRVVLATIVFAILMLILLAAIALLGSELLTRLYGSEFREYYWVLLALALASTVTNVGIPTAKALTQLRCERWNFGVALVSFAMTLIFAVILLKVSGTTGAAWGLIVGSVVSTGSRWAILNRKLRLRSSELGMRQSEAPGDTRA